MYELERGSPSRPFGSALLPVLVVTLAACASGSDAARDTSSVGGAAVAAAGGPASGSDEAADREVKNYRLTMDKVDRYYNASRNVLIAGSKMPQPKSNEAEDSSNLTFDQIVALYDKEPTARQAIARAGLSTREFVLVMFSYMTAAMTAQVLKMDPKANVDSLAREMEVDPANLRFIRQNEAELQKKQKAFDELKAKHDPTQ